MSNASRVSEEKYDVAVVGAGPAGSAAARVLAQRGVRTILLEAQQLGRRKPCGDALTPSALEWLLARGLEDTVRDALRTSHYSFSTSGFGPVTRPWPAREMGPSRVGCVIPRETFDARMAQAAQRAGATVVAASPVLAIGSRERGRSELQVRAGPSGVLKLEADLVILAAGARSRRLAREAPNTFDHPAMSCEVSVSSRLPGQLRFFLRPRTAANPASGYGWIFPTADGTRANIGYAWFRYTESRSSRGNLRRASSAFLQGAMALLRSEGMSPSICGPYRAWPIPTSLVLLSASPRALLFVGDGAGLPNPFTGEGIGPALMSGEAAANAGVQYFHHRSIRRLHNDYWVGLRETPVRTSVIARGLTAAIWRSNGLRLVGH